MHTNRFARTSRTLILIVLTSVILPARGRAEETPSPAGDSGSAVEAALDVLVHEALERNQGLAARRHALEAARHRIPQAGALDDPMAGIALSNFPLDSLSTDETPMTGVELRWSQRLPWPGKRALREEAASWEAAAAEEEVNEASNRLAASVRETFYDLYLLDRTLEITGRNKALLQDIARGAEKRYAVGRGQQADVTRAHVAVSRCLARLVSLEERRDGTLARLNALRSRPPNEPVETPRDLPRRVLQVPPEDLAALAEGGSPTLARFDRRIEAARAMESLAAKALRPDFTAGFSYRLRDDVPMDPVSGEDFVSASLMVNLPIFARNKQRMKRAEAVEGVRRLEALREGEVYRLHSSVQELAAGLEAGRLEAILFETGILPLARQSMESSRAGYEVNKLDFLSYLDAQVTLFAEEINYYRVVTRYQKQLARLEAEIGLPLGSAAAAGEEG